MIKISYSTATLFLVVGLAVPIAILAEDNATGGDNSSAVSAGATTSSVNRSEGERAQGIIKPKPLRPLPAVRSLRQELEKDKSKENGNEDVRDAMEAKRENSREKASSTASSTRPFRPAFGPLLRAFNTSTKETLKETIGERRAKEIEHYAGQMLERMQAGVNRLERIAKRITLRLDRLTVAGIDTAKWKSDLVAAETLITDAQTKLDATKTNIESKINSDDPKGSFEKVRADVAVLRDALKNAHSALVNVVEEIKASAEARQSERSETRSTTTPRD